MFPTLETLAILIFTWISELGNKVGGANFGEQQDPPFIGEVLHVHSHYGDDVKQHLR